MAVKSQIAKLTRLNKALTAKNLELQETLSAIQCGEVDALVVHGPLGERVFTLQSVEQPYRELIEAMNEGALTISPDGIILYCNARFEAMTRLPFGKLVGSEFKNYVRPESQKSLESLLQRSRSMPSTAEVSLYVTDQILLPVQLSVSAIELVGTEGFCIIATDLSAQKQNAILFQQQEWLLTMLSLLPVPMVLLDTEMKGFTFINAKATEVLQGGTAKGLSRALVPTRLDFKNENGDSVQIRDVMAKIDSNEKSTGVEMVLATQERKIQVLLFSETLPAMHGREPARLLMFHDISTIKQAQLDLSLALRGRDQFVATLSHELRTPISVILGWVQLLRANPTDETIFKQALDTLDRNAELQRDLIENLLDMSRIITGNLVLETKSLDLKTAVRDGLTSLQPKAEEKGIEFRIDLEEDLAIVSADEKRIQQLISNLVQNALKFTPSGGKVTVKVRTDKVKKMASISVEDNGQGIDQKFLPHVFDQFRQQNMTTNRSYGGLGLGLTICKTIVEQHHGEIEATSDGRGKGALFVVHLPLSAQPKKSALPRSTKPEVLDLKGLRVLLVDDSPDNLILFSIWLKKGGADIKTLDSALNVVAALETFKPHVLLTDICMPGEDGYALIAKVRALSIEKGGEVPAGALTANARIEDCAQSLAAGFQLHIAKPVTNGGLLKAVHSLAKMGREKSVHQALFPAILTAK